MIGIETEEERQLIREGKAIEAIQQMRTRGIKFSEAVHTVKMVRLDLEKSRKALIKINQGLNKAFAPLIRKYTREQIDAWQEDKDDAKRKGESS